MKKIKVVNSVTGMKYGATLPDNEAQAWIDAHKPVWGNEQDLTIVVIDINDDEEYAAWKAEQDDLKADRDALQLIKQNWDTLANADKIASIKTILKEVIKLIKAQIQENK